MTEANATLEYETYDYSLPHSKTVDLIGEEFIKKENCGVQTQAGGLVQLAQTASMIQRTMAVSTGAATTAYATSAQTSLPPLTYTTTTIPTISTQAASGEENGVLYCNLDDLSRYIPDNFNFDTMESMEADSVQDSLSGELSRVQVLSLPPHLQNSQYLGSKPINISMGQGCQYQIQLKPGTSLPSSFSLPGGFVDTTKLAGQLSVVQELPEVSRLVFQEVKQEEGQDSIVNILETMKQEEPGSLSPLDYTVSSTSEAPLNLVNNLAKGVKRVVGPVQSQDAKRIKNVYLVQGENGQQIIQEMPGSTGGYTYTTAQRSSPSPGLAQDLVQGLPQGLCLDPPSPLGNSIKKEPKSKSTSPKLSLTKTINGTTIPSSKTCNWVFENGQVCGKTFSKSYNLVVHMRMHEDIRPFACTLCDQTFRQKAHLQRHETTHGIQTKNFYRTPSSKRKKKRNPSGEGVNNELSKNLQDRLARVNQNLNKAHREGGDSEGEEYMEDEEDDMYVPNGNPAKKAALRDLRKYSEKEQRATDGELDGEDGKGSPLGIHSRADSREHLQGGGQLMAEADDDNSTVQDILQTVNSVPTLEQKLESSAYLNCDSLLLRALPTNKPIMSVSAAPSYLPVTSTSSYSTTSLPHITKLVESTSISGVSLPSSLATTCPQTLPGSCYFTSSAGATAAQTNILFTTLSAHTSTSSSPHKTLSFIETSVPASIANSYTNGNVSSHKSQHGQIVIDNIDDHSPEIQAEILNALLADESYPEQGQVEEMWEEEIFRLSTLPPTWWVSRKRRAGSSHGEVTYYSPEGYSFKSKTEIQDFLTNNVVPKEPAELRLPPLPIEQIPVIEETFVRPSSTPMDTNSIAQALIANLKPEPIESLKDALSCEPKLRESLSLQASPTCSPLNC